MNPYLVNSRNQYYRFITCGFIHQDHMHLIGNMISLYFFGPFVEMYFLVIFKENAVPYFMAFYILGIIVAGIPSYLKHRHHPGYNALGASGGISSVIFAAIIFKPLIQIYFLPGFIVGILYLIWSYFQGKRGADNIGHDAHLYGALFGVLFCVVMHPPSLMDFIHQIMEWRWGGFGLLQHNM